MTNAAALADFTSIGAAFDAIEGMTSLPSAHLFHLFLANQTGHIEGPMLEIGPYKGKSAVILAHHLRDRERLDLVDVHPYLERDAFAAFGDRVRLHLGSSDDLKRLLPDYGAQRKRYRFIHSDASHTFSNVLNDLVHADALLHPQGVLSVDDYENPNYPQVPLAVGAALYGQHVALAPFLVCNNKAYLCRPSQRNNMMAFVVNEIAPVICGEHSFMMACTDTDERSPMTLRPISPGEAGDVYGAALYGEMINRWRRPSPA